MGDAIDDILGEEPKKAAAPAGDDIDALLGDEPPAIAGLTKDVGAMSRARAGRAPGPRPYTADAEPAYGGRQVLSPLPLHTMRPPVVPGVTRPFDPMEADPIAQAVATTTVLGPLGRTITSALTPTLGRAAAPLVSTAEGGAASAMMGGDVGEGLGIGALGGLGGLLARAATPAAATARIESRLATDVNKGVTKASKRIANEVKFKAGEGNADLAQVADELPDVGKALKTQAKTNPKAAHKVTGKALDELTDANDKDFAAIQRQHGGVPLQPIAERLAGLEERLNQQGHGVSADAVARVRTDLLKRYGSGEAGLAEAKLTAQQVRNIRNDMGTVAFGDQIIKPNTKRQALGKIYGILNKEIEDVAANTRGVDPAAMKMRNRQISTLIPVRDALAERAEKLADREVHIVGIKPAIGAAKKAGQRISRGIDYRLSRIPVGGELAEGPLTASAPVAVANSRDYARSVSDSMGGGMSLQDAMSVADAGADKTKLSQADETKYQAWRAKLPKELQYEGDYDLRGFYLKNPTFTATSGQHMTDEFKLPNHPTFSNESRFYNERTKHLGGHWEGDVYIPNDTKYKKRVDESSGNS